MGMVARVRCCVGALVMYFLLTGSALGGKQDTVQWLRADFSPCHMPKEDEQGYCDLHDEYVIARLPQYRHEIALSSFPRYANLMETDSSFCTSDLLKTDARDMYLHYSEPVLPVLPNGVVHRKDDERFKPFIERNGKVDLRRLVQSGLLLGINAGRVYGHIIDDILEEHSASAALTEFESERDAIKLVIAQRIDYTFASPVELGYLASHSAGVDAVVYRTVVRMPPLVNTYYSCRDDPLGRAIINAINTILQEDDFYQSATRFYSRWLPEEVRPYYQEVLADAGYWSSLKR